jgi:tetratricopeptide (TPR) repeat protein
MRVIAVAAAISALVGSIVIYSKNLADWRTSPSFVEQAGGTQAAIAPEGWPICTTMTSVATDADWVQLDPDFKTGKKALAAEDWKGAIAAFEVAALQDPFNADVQNYIGYGYRRLRELGPAIGHYQRALMLNPRHRSAHEHLGEAYLMLGEPAKAEQLLTAHLKRILKLGRLRLRGPRGAQDEFVLAAIAQNLARPPPAKALCIA